MTEITRAGDVPPRLTDYEAERATFRIEVPERFNAVIDIVERWAAESPADMALVSLDGQGDVAAEQTVADLARESRRAARALLALGIQKGDPVFVMLPRVPAWYSAVLGAIRIGAVPMPGTNQLTSRDIAYRLRSADAVAAAEPNRAKQIMRLRATWPPRDPSRDQDPFVYQVSPQQ